MAYHLKIYIIDVNMAFMLFLFNFHQFSKLTALSFSKHLLNITQISLCKLNLQHWFFISPLAICINSEFYRLSVMIDTKAIHELVVWPDNWFVICNVFVKFQLVSLKLSQELYKAHPITLIEKEFFDTSSQLI